MITLAIENPGLARSLVRARMQMGEISLASNVGLEGQAVGRFSCPCDPPTHTVSLDRKSALKKDKT